MNWKLDFSTHKKQYLVAVLISTGGTFLLAGYECIRSSSNTLFKAAYGKENLPLIMTFMAIGLIVALYLYGRCLSRFGAQKTLLVTSIVSFMLLMGCFLAINYGINVATGLLYIIREVYIVLLIEQYWSFLNSSFDQDHAKVFNGPICGITSLGAIAGGLAVHQLALVFGTNAMVLLGALSVVPAALFTDLAYRWCGEPKTPNQLLANHHQQKDHLGLYEFKNQPLLVILLGVVILTQVVAVFTNLNFQGILQDTIPDPDQQTSYSGAFYAQLNAVAGILQFIFAPLALRFVDVIWIHLLIPLLHISAAIYFIHSPSLASAGITYTLFKAIDYSIFRSAKEILYIPFSFDVRYRAKEVIDVFGYRFSKGFTSLLITIAQKLGLIFSETLFAVLAACSAAAWFLLMLGGYRAKGLKSIERKSKA